MKKKGGKKGKKFTEKVSKREKKKRSSPYPQFFWSVVFPVEL